jgi:hypothetical protein
MSWHDGSAVRTERDISIPVFKLCYILMLPIGINACVYVRLNGFLFTDPDPPQAEKNCRKGALARVQPDR